MSSKLVTRDNVEEFELISRSALSPAFAHFYNDPHVMRYSDTPLTTPK
jgi:hypothetical protein